MSLIFSRKPAILSADAPWPPRPFTWKPVTPDLATTAKPQTGTTADVAAPPTVVGSAPVESEATRVATPITSTGSALASDEEHLPLTPPKKKQRPTLLDQLSDPEQLAYLHEQYGTSPNSSARFRRSIKTAKLANSRLNLTAKEDKTAKPVDPAIKTTVEFVNPRKPKP